jgi:hypothetical protein
MASQNLIFTWTLLETYENCPFSCFHKNVLKDIPWVETEQNKWGNEAHAALERSARLRKPLEGRFEVYQWVADIILKAKGELRPEVRLGIKRDFSACDFFDNDVWLRGNADLTIDYGNWAWALDYKTGKKKRNSKQLMLMALLLFARFPKLDKILTSFLWLQEPVQKPEIETFYRAQIPELWGNFLPLMKEIEECYEREIWYKRQNGLCKAWCPVLGCEYNGRFGK